MKVDVEKHGTVNVVVPRDALTEAAVGDVQQVLESEVRQTRVRLVLDLTHVPFVDSAGIEFLLTVAGNASAGAMRPRLAGVNETVREALFLTGTLPRFYLFDSVEAAVRSYL